MTLGPKEAFTEFVESDGSRIQHGLVATYGPEVGMDAAAEAFAYAWKNWSRIEEMKNPAGYVYTIGRNAGRRSFRRPSWPTPTNDTRSTPWVEPGLPRALEQLTERQRVATVLIHGGEWTLAEVAELMSVDRGTVQKHADRGIAKLRAALEVNIDA